MTYTIANNECGDRLHSSKSVIFIAESLYLTKTNIMVCKYHVNPLNEYWRIDGAAVVERRLSNDF